MHVLQKLTNLRKKEKKKKKKKKKKTREIAVEGTKARVQISLK